jgi:hypothetical protein
MVEIAVLLIVGHRCLLGLGKPGENAHLKGRGPRNLRKKDGPDMSLGGVLKFYKLPW